MRRAILAFALFLAGCDDSGDAADANPAVADASPDEIDARPADAMVSLPDGAVSGSDAGPGVNVQTACARACSHIAMCFMEPVGTCEAECSADLADCSQAEVQQVYDCGGVECDQLKTCIGSIPCVMG